MNSATAQKAAVAIGLMDLYRAVGLETPHVGEGTDLFFAAHPSAVLTKADLMFMLRFAGGDLTQLLEAIPAEKVPFEIRGAWYCARETLRDIEVLSEFLNDEDNPLALSRVA